jgi:acyl transferase domain-containing protein
MEIQTMKAKHTPLIMVFSGQGPQTLSMGRILFNKIPMFRDTIIKLDKLYKKQTDISLIKDVGFFGNKVATDEELNQPNYTVITLSFLQLALFELLKNQFEIKPNVVVGHSLGELAMLYASGQLSLEQTAKIAIARSESVKQLSCMGSMIAISSGIKQIQSYLDDLPECWIAANNSPQSCTISGTFESLVRLEKRIKAKEPNCSVHHLAVGNAYHSSLMNEIKEIYLNKLNELFNEEQPISSTVHIMSTVTGEWYNKLITPQYCWDNVELPVLFNQAISGILKKYPSALFIEIAPHPVLSTYMEENGVNKLAFLMHKLKPEIDFFINGLSDIEEKSNENINGINRLKISLQDPHKISPPPTNTDSLQRKEIAIIGIGCRFPGGVKNKKDYWNLLREGKLAIQKVPEDRWDANAFYSVQNVPGKITNKCGGFIENVFDFDYSEFGISFAEARAMDPAQRILLEVCFQALEDASICFRGTNTGVFVGGEPIDHILMMDGAPEFATPYHITGVESGITANHISFVFNLKGPSLMVDTACASSLTSLHVAVNSLYTGDCEQAVVLGINLLLEPLTSVYYSRLGVLSPTGLCHVFDAKADGYVRSEGCGAVIIKPLGAALKDGNNIYAVITATAISSNGANKSLTMPSQEAQQELFTNLLAKGRISGESIDYSELHGTGTPVGDPIEVNSVGKVLCSNRSFDNPLLIGSVKGNLGHLEYAAGIASLIKVALMLKQRCLVPTISHEQPNPAIHWNRYPLNVATSMTHLPRDRLIRMTVSAYGFGGANALALITSAPNVPLLEGKFKVSAEKRKAIASLFVVAGLNKLGTERLIQLWQQKEIEPNIASSIMLKRSQPLQWRSYAVGHELKNLVFSKPKFCPNDAHRPIIFTIAGDGGYHPLMGHYLYHRFSAFRDSINELDDLLRKSYLEKEEVDKSIKLSDEMLEAQAICSLLDIGLFRDGNLKSKVTGAMATLATFFFHIATIDLLKSFGINPDAIHGISLGELSAAYAAGEFDKKGIFQLRGSLEKTFTKSDYQKGGVINILAAPGEKNIFSNKALSITKALIKGIPDLYIAIDVDPTSVSVAGTNAALSMLAKRCNEKNIKFIRIAIGVPVHSPLATNEPIENLIVKLSTIMNELKITPPQIPVISSYTGLIRTEALDAEYMINMAFTRANIRRSLSTLIKEYPNSFIIEIAPSAQMFAPLLRCGLGKPYPVADYENEVNTFLNLLGELTLINQYIDPIQLNGDEPIDLDLAPNYLFENRMCTLESPSKRQERLHHKKLPFSSSEFYVSTELYPWLQDYQIDNRIIFPIAGFIEVVIKHGFNAIKNFHIHSPWPITEEPQLAQFSQQDIQWAIHNKQIIYASGEATKTHYEPRQVDINHFNLTMTEIIPAQDHYNHIKEKATIVYGKSFELITEFNCNKNEVLAIISWKKELYLDFLLPPPVIESALQTIIPLIPFPSVLSTIEHVHYYEPLPELIYVYAIINSQSVKSAMADLMLCTSEGKVCASFKNIMVTRFTPAFPQAPRYYKITPTPLTLPSQKSNRIKPLIFLYHGNPQELVEICKTHDQATPLALWILCEDKPESAAILGLGRSLINEYPFWQVKLIRIKSNLLPKQQQKALRDLQEREWELLPSELYLEETGWFYPKFEEIQNQLTTKVSSTSLNHTHPFTEDTQTLLNLFDTKQLGKTVISNYSEQSKTKECNEVFHPEKYYILIGGCGALGMELLSWLVEENAQHIILTSRRAIIDPQQNYILESAKQKGINIQVLSVDATNKDQMSSLFANLNLPLGGIFLLSALFDDKPIHKLDAESFDKVNAPKILAAQIVLELVNPNTIEFLVLFSSVSSVFGNPGQGNYAFANAYFDELARNIPYVRVANLPGIMNIGQLKQNPQVLKKIEAVGLKTCRSDAIGPLLKQLILGNEKQIIGLSTRWDVLYNSLASTHHSIPNEWLEQSKKKQTEAQNEDLSHSLRHLLATTFGIDYDMLDEEAPLVQYGLDSLNATAICNKINLNFCANLRQQDLLSGISIASLRQKLELEDSENTLPKLPLGVVRLNSSNQGTPIFFIHDITGDVDIYRPLCIHLNVPCYGITKHPFQLGL